MAATICAQQSRPTLSGYLQLREFYQSPTGMTATVEGARVYLNGSLAQFTYRLSADLGQTVELADAWVRWSPNPAWRFTVGQLKTPFSRQYLLERPRVEFADRAAVAESLPPKRDIGVMAAYTWKTVATLSAGVFNGEGPNTLTNSDSTVLAVVRVTVRPFEPLDLGANVATYGSDSTRYGADAAMVSGSVSGRVEFIDQHHAGTPSEQDDLGWYVEGMYQVHPHVQLLLRQEDLRRPASQPRDIATTAGAALETSDHHVRATFEYISRAVAGVRHGEALGQLQLTF
jgi:hypothetical protein